MRLPWQWHSPLSSSGGGWGYFDKKKTQQKPTIHSSSPLVVHRGVALLTSQVLRMDLVHFFLPNTFLAGEEKGRGWGVRHFQLMIISACVESCGSAARLHFMGKSVSHHCVLRSCQTLTRLEAVVFVCVESRRRWFPQSSTVRGRIQTPLEPLRWKQAARQTLQVSICLSGLILLIHPMVAESWFWFCQWWFLAWPSQQC